MGFIGSKERSAIGSRVGCAVGSPDGFLVGFSAGPAVCPHVRSVVDG